MEQINIPQPSQGRRIQPRQLQFTTTTKIASPGEDAFCSQGHFCLLPCHLAEPHQGAGFGTSLFCGECGRLPSLLAKGGGRQKVTFRHPQKARGQMEPWSHPARLCSALPARRRWETSRQQQAGGRRSTRQNAKAIFVLQNIPEFHVRHAAESWESEFQEGNKEP